MTEPMVMGLLVAGPACWLIGGYRWKWVRRFLLPAIYAGVAIFSGVTVLSTILLFAVTAVVNCLPYGDRTPFWLKTLVFGSLAIPALVININLWPMVLVASAVLTGVFLASQKWNQVTWKIAEGFMGFIQSSAIIVAVLWR